MKILLVSIPSLHFFNWANQLKDAGHEVYWFDIIGRSKPVDKISWIKQKVDWKLKWDFPGRTFIKSKAPKPYNFIQRLNENNVEEVFEQYLKEVQPDIVHSFTMQLSCIPIFDVMSKYKNVKWIYSSWGSDVYYYKNIGIKESDFKKVLQRVDFYISDCKRDAAIVAKNGFKNAFLGVFPGNGGIDFDVKAITPFNERKVILIKGYNDAIGKGEVIVKAIAKIPAEFLKDFEIIIYGGDEKIRNFINKSDNFRKNNYQFYSRSQPIRNEELLKIMGRSLLHIGNSLSDGISNSMLEAMGMGAFPIQSNPGNATAEVIKDGVNGFLIEDCESEKEIKWKIIAALSDRQIVEEAYNYNTATVRKEYSSVTLKSKIVELYEKNYQESVTEDYESYEEIAGK